MSILIKDMEMPQVCADCPFRSMPELFMFDVNRYHYISRCTRTSEEIEDPWRDVLWQLEHKESWCPLIEVPTPHGRLIDADALLEHLGDTEYKGAVKRVLMQAPVIIEAEEGQR